MATNLSNYFRLCRLDLGLRPGDLARHIGRETIVGTANKIVRFEQTGDVPADLFGKLQAALGINDVTVERLIEQDRRNFVVRWNKWADQPIEPHLVVRVIPGVFIQEPLPEGIDSAEDMQHYAAEYAKQFGKKVWLVLSRRRTIFYGEDGTKLQNLEAAPGKYNGPFMQIAGKGQKFLFTGGLEMHPLTEPEMHGPK